MKVNILLVFILISTTAPAQEYLSLDSFLGQWEGTGELFTQEAKYKMTWEEALEGQYVKLTFSNEMIASGQGIKAEAYYQPSGEHDVIGKWFDNRGYFVEIEGTLDQTSLTSHWVNEHEQGKTIYTLVSSDSISVEDFVWKNEEYVPFGKAQYSKLDE